MCRRRTGLAPGAPEVPARRIAVPRPDRRERDRQRPERRRSPEGSAEVLALDRVIGNTFKDALPGIAPARIENLSIF